MKCSSCDYPLWNLPPGPCPECGTPFTAADHTFTPNSVQFLCPHCRQDYYGTAHNGHLEPDAFTCVRCVRPIDIRQMLVLPAAGIPEHITRPDEHPWLESPRSVFIRLIKTVLRACFDPGSLARAARGDRAGDALRFAALLSAVLALIGAGFFATFIGLVSMGGGLGNMTNVAMGVARVVGVVVATALGLLLLALLWALVTHALLLVLARPAAGLPRTTECFCYALGPMSIGAVPCLGFYLLPFGAIWMAVSAIVQLRTRQHISGWSASVAVLTPPALGFITLIALIAIA